MILLFNLCLFLSCVTSSLSAFDVRVLLDKLTIPDVKKVVCKISSQHGMVISGIEKPIQGPVSIICTDQEFIINDTVIKDQTILISPTLPLNHEKKNRPICCTMVKR